MRIVLLLILMNSVSTFTLYGQDTIPTIIIEKLEDALENQAEEEEIDINNIADDLSFFSKDPVDLNAVTEVQLEEMQILNSIQIQDFLSYRNVFGPIYSEYELQAIRSFDMETIKEFIPFVKVSGNNEQRTFKLKQILQEGTSQLIFKSKRVLEEQQGYISENGEEPDYRGDRNHHFARYKFDYGQVFKVGFTGEKDPGEEFFTGSNSQGFDFYSGYITARDIKGWLKDVTVGDYTISMGQGLILHNSFGGRKSSQVMNIKKGGRVIKPYSSVNEANLFRGAATTIGLHKNLNLSVFHSNVNVSGNVNVDTVINAGFSEVTSVIINGFHRTENEISRKNSVQIQSTGFALEYKRKALGLSFNGLRSRFNNPFNPNTEQLYRRYTFSGDQLTNASLGYSYRLRNFNFFGEIASSDNGAVAQIHGVLLGLDRKIDLSFSFRDYPRDYQALNPNAFAEASRPFNERGFYMGLSMRPTKRWLINSYVDMWRNPWLSFRRDAPGGGVDYFTRIEYNIKRKLNVYAQYKYEEKLLNINGDAPIDRAGLTKLHRLRLNLSQTVNKSISLKTRAEFSFFNINDTWSKGSLFFQDINYKPEGSNYQLTARFSIFDTDNFDTRIYAYENDILYEFSIPFYQNRGTRYYVKAKYRFSRLLSAEMRLSRTHLSNQDSSGSAGQLINGPDRTEIKALVRFKF